MSTTIEMSEKNLRPMLQQFNEGLGVYINDKERYLLGRVLTIIDASIADPEQRKAIKDLVNGEWWNPGNRGMPVEGMGNPHSDLRAICKLLGFELYDQNSLAAPSTYREDETLEWEQKRYKTAIENRK